MAKRIDALIIVNDLNLNGITTVILNYLPFLLEKGLSIAIAVNRGAYDPIKQRLNNLGVELFILPNKSRNAFSYSIRLFQLLKELQPQIVHVNASSSVMCMELLCSAMAGVKSRIAHCHNSSCKHLVLHRILKPVVHILATTKLACSDIAGQWQFYGDFTVLPNAFNIDRFRFNENDRESTRLDLGITKDTILIGDVARLNYVKNQFFCVELLKSLSDMGLDYRLLLVGDGPQKTDLQLLVKENQIDDRVIFYGNASDTASLYSAMDIFLFPSKYEGLGISVVEAQLEGLPCIVSDAIPDNAIISDLVYKIDLNINKKDWVETIITSSIVDLKKRKLISSRVDGSPFDISRCGKALAHYYLGEINKHNSH